MSEQQYLWAPTPDKPKRGRVWLIVVLAVVALLIVGGVLWLALRPGAPDADPAATTSPSASASASPSESATPSAEPAPSDTPVTSPPPVPDPSLETFRGQVGGWLDDALTGLDIVSKSSGQDAQAVIGNLQDDAQRLAEAAPPSSISSKWRDGVSQYSTQLSEMEKQAGSRTAVPVNTAEASVASLRDLIGM
ncbi:hypothetical protein [Microbacterium sp.]|uniref:hypothetical protein n=1 Tax=Microbacterium sp. TaxID=51671 RepID=UPI003C76899A